MKLLFTLIFLTVFAHAHEDLEPRELQENSLLTVWLPFKVGADGGVSFFKDATSAFAFSPFIQLGGTLENSTYNYPERSNHFALEAPLSGKYMHVHRRKLQAGLGLGTVYTGVVKLGLIPFKGSSQKLVHVTHRPSPKKLPLNLMPETLNDLEDWAAGDYGSFETFGGLELQAGAGIGIADFIGLTLSMQNEFIIELKKLSSTEVSLAISEGHVKKRKLTMGLPISSVTLANFQGKRLGAEFVLDLTNSTHHKLYQSALQGKLTELQKSLPSASQRLSWKGHVRSTSLGIPVLIGKDSREGELDIKDNDKERTVYFKSKKNTGLILPKRDVHRFVHASDRELVLFWSTEMKGVKGNALNKYFVSIGRSLGMEGFERDVEKKIKLGSSLSQLGLTLRRDELDLITSESFVSLEENYQQKCEELSLSCRKDGKGRKTISKLRSILRGKNSLGTELGKYLLKHPALIASLVRVLQLQKKAYFYFLSDRYGSREGMVPLSP